MSIFVVISLFRETRQKYGKLSNCKLQLYPKPTHPTTLTVNPYSEFSRFFYCMFYMQSFPGFTHMYYLFKFPHMYYSFSGFNQTVRYIFPYFPNLQSCQNLTPDQPKIDSHFSISFPFFNPKFIVFQVIGSCPTLIVQRQGWEYGGKIQPV